VFRAVGRRQLQRFEHCGVEGGGLVEVGDVEVDVVDQASGMKLHGFSFLPRKQKAGRHWRPARNPR
jgi:hypothetical protein